MEFLSTLQPLFSLLAHLFVLILAFSVYGTSRRLHLSLIVISGLLETSRQTNIHIDVTSSETLDESTSTETGKDRTGVA